MSVGRPRLLDLFCGEGGASVGYDPAGFDVTGVAGQEMPGYPFPLVQSDAVSPADPCPPLGPRAPCERGRSAAL